MLLNTQALERSSCMHPEIEQFMEAFPTPPPDWDDASTIAAAMTMVSKQGLLQAGSPEATLNERYVDVPMRDGYQSRTKVYRPAKGSVQGCPLIVNIYGGGWIAGDSDVLTPMCRAWVRLFGAVVVSISYRLAPEHQWPVPWNDAWDSVAWVAGTASQLGADPSKGFVIGGVSAGGTLSAFVTSQSQTQKLAYPITGQWLSVPSLTALDAVPERYKAYHVSLAQNNDAPILPASALTRSLKNHVKWDSTSPMRYPALYGTDILSKLPPTYLQADGMDPLRDDALIYHEMLVEAGVDATIDLYEGCPHAHFAFMPGTEISVKAETDITRNIGRLLGKKVLAEEAKRAMLKPEA